jgi:hypothetical protein
MYFCFACDGDPRWSVGWHFWDRLLNHCPVQGLLPALTTRRWRNMKAAVSVAGDSRWTHIKLNFASYVLRWRFFLVSSLGIPCYIWGMAIGLSLFQGHIYVYIHMATLIKTLIGQPQHTATAEKQSRQQSSRKSSKVHSIHCVVFGFITVFPQLASCFIINALERPVSQRC